MSTTNSSKHIDKAMNEDSILSNSTNISFNESLIQDLSKAKNIFLISKNFEQKIVDILSYLQSDANLALNKILVLKYLQSLFLKVDFNSEIFLRKFTNDKEKLNLYQIIIYQYICYTNSGNSKLEEDNYRDELKSLFILLLSQITFEKETYHYILSFLIYFINERNITNAINKKTNLTNNNDIQDDQAINFNSEYLSRILELLKVFYKYTDSYNETPNYFFFSGDSDSSIIIPNKENPKDHNKKILNLDDTLCIMLFIKVLPSEYIKAVYPIITFRLLELRFNDKNKKNININMDINNKLTTSYTNEPLYKLKDNEINCILIKFSKKKKIINSEIFVGFNRIELPPLSIETKSGKLKDEIKEIVLFKNFIGICTNIIIYKEKKGETLPKFLFSLDENQNKLRQSFKGENNNNNNINNQKRKSTFNVKSIFPNGIYNEELYSYFTKVELKDQVDQNILTNNIKIKKEVKINVNEFKDFLNHNLISIYMPTRVDIPSQIEDRSSSNTFQIILKDSINNLDAEFSIRSPSLNGVHTYSIKNDDFSKFGGINNLLPIIEIMTNYSELLTPENFSSYFTLIANYVFSPQYEEAIIKENNSNFFMSLSYFLEKIPNNYFNERLIENFKLILSLFTSNNEYKFFKLNKQFNNYILMNEKILFKFNEEDQKSIINQICLTAKQKNFEVDIIKIIKILLNYDRKKNYKFCCKNHAEYFNDNSSIIDGELSSRIKPIEKLFEIIFEKKYKLIQEKKNIISANNSIIHNKNINNKNIINSDENIYENNNLYYLFYLLCFDISPCLQKSIICLLTNIIEKYSYESFVKIFDKKEELFDIVLFVFKTSIFDVKIHSLNLLLLIEENNKGKNLNDNDKKTFFQNEIIPIFLVDNINNLQINKNDKDNKDNEYIEKTNNLEKKETDKKEENSEIIDDKKDDEKIDVSKDNDNSGIYENNIKIVENEINEKEEKDIINIEKEIKINDTVDINKINEIKNSINEKREELEKELNEDEFEDEEKKVKYGIKSDLEIEGVKYYIFYPTDVHKKINQKFNKKKYYSLINGLYEKVIKYFNENNVCINFKLYLLIKIVSSGDLLLINTFVNKILSLIDGNDSEKKEKAYFINEISSNKLFLHWILETAFQLYILKFSEKDKNNKPFIPGFSLDIYKNNNILDELKVPYSDNEKKSLYDNIYKECQKIIKFILDSNISKADYILTWSKYYLELIEENNIFIKIKDFLFELIQDLLYSRSIGTFSEQNFLGSIKAKNTLYYFNLFFEFFTFYKLKYNESFFKRDKKYIIKKISNDFKYILFNRVEKEIKLEPIQELESCVKKIDSYTFIKSLFSVNSIIWNGNEKKIYKNENDIYSNNKNTYINELEILFYNFNNDYLKENDDNYCNKGIPLIIIIYHFFISFLNAGGSIDELNQLFQDFRLFIMLLIISSSTLNSTETSKKKNWPKEDQYKEVQIIVESILFNFLFYFYNKIKEFINEINNYNLKIKNEEKNKEKIEYYKKNLECLSILKRTYIENFGYFLKLLNKIYRGVKNEEKQKKNISNFLKNMFKTQTEGVKKSGPFLLIEKMYNESPELNINDPNNNNLRKTLGDSTKTPQIDLTNENELNINENIEKSRKNAKSIRSIRISHKTSSNISNYLTDRRPEIPPLNLDFTYQKTYDNVGSIDDMYNQSLNLSAERGLNKKKSSSKKTIRINEENYLDKICQILFIQKESKELKINLTDDIFNQLEKHINSFLNDKNIGKFYESHYEEYNKDLYPFISIIEKRQSMIKELIPIYDNTKNVSLYPINICLMPYYYPENKYQKILIEKIESNNKLLNEEIQLIKKKNELKEFFKCQIYKKTKKRLFKFNGIWSNQDFFYDYEKYRLKYKLLNHMTNDFTKIFMTPITDIEYYLPKFSMFKGNIFRNNNESNIIPITKTVELCFGLKDTEKKNIVNNNSSKNMNKENLKTENKSEILTNTHQSFDSLNNSSISNNSEIKQENINNKYIPLYELNQENYPFLKEVEIKESDKSNLSTNMNDFNEKDYLIFIDYIKRKHFKENEEHCLISEACLVRYDFHIRGIIYINDKEIGFYSYETKRVGDEEDFDNDKKICFGSIFKKKKDNYNQYYLKLPFKGIELIFKRRYYFKKNALEIYNQDKKSYFFRIDETKFKSFLDTLKYQLKNDLEDITIEYTKTDNKIGLINKNNIFYNYNNYNNLFNSKRIPSIKTLYLKWIKWEISTFTLLNVINIYSNRSYNDINQYPVFPWIITDYTSNVLPNLSNSNTNKNLNSSTNNNTPLTNPDNSASIIRPFNTPMGMLEISPESKERKLNYQEHWESLENDDDKDENYDRYGSHYSTSLYLTYYLVRVFPFSYIRIELQGKNFDDPNRLFNSLSDSFNCASTQKSDLRELIPEFFCLPEMFYNSNDLNLGSITDNKTKLSILVNDIEMPPWANGDAYIFVKKHRELLESVEISEKINEWFNIIFGSKQKGKGAKTIGNLFIKQTYDDYDEIHKNSNLNEKIYQKRMVEFGVTPSQVFKNDTKKRYEVKFLKKPILYNFQLKLGKKEDMKSTGEEFEISDSEVYLEGTPYKIFSSLKKNEDVKNEKILFLYNDKIKIISKTNEKGFLKKNINKSSKDLKNNENKNTKENEENKDKKDKKEKETEQKDENNNKINNEDDNEDDNEENNSEEELDKVEGNTKNNKETISKYDKILISPKCRMNIEKAPTLIYDKGNYIVFGGFWNGNILIHKLEEIGNKKDKSQKNINIISTNNSSPITHIKIDISETFVICANKIGIIYIFIIDSVNEGEWSLYKIINDSQKEIKSIDINENLNIFVTCDKDGYINLYTIPTCKLFNSYKLNDNIIPNNNAYTNYSRSISNTIIYSVQSNIYVDHVIISQSPLPCLIFYIQSRKSLIVFSINFHFIKELRLGYEIVPNGIKKYSDYFNKDYLFIYNQRGKTIDVYNLIDLNIIGRSVIINDTFIDFHFSKEMDHALILVKINNDNKSENVKDKTEQRNYKILLLKSPGRGDIKLF